MGSAAQARSGPDVPRTLAPYPRRTLLDVVAETARARPEHPALLFEGARMSYRRLEQLSDAFAAALAALGVGKGDTVALLVPNAPQAVVAQLGAWKAGAVAAPLNPLYTADELEPVLRSTGARVAVVLTPFYEKLKAVQGRTAVRHVIATRIREHLPPVLRILFALAKERKGGHRIALRGGDLWMPDLLRAHARAPRPAVEVGCDDPALLLFTGGTTGVPKAAICAHASPVQFGIQLRAWMEGIFSEWNDVLLVCMPLFHVYGNVGVLGAGLVAHMPLVLVPNPRDLDRLVATIRRTRPAFLPGVPTLFNALASHRDVASGKVDLRCVKLSLCGAAPLLAETKARFERITGGRIVEGYALTESMMGTVMTPVRGAYKPGSCGLPLPDVEVRIVDADDGERALAPGEVGEITLRAPQLMRGYLGHPEETARTLRDGWLYTGDLGTLDEDGYLFLVDRKKDVVKTSGFQVWPREVEEVLAAHPAVAEAAVAGVPDPVQGEAVKAWIVARPGARATAEDLRSHCREKLVGYKIPTQFVFRDALPKSAVGKVLRRVLVDEDRVARAAMA
jgi:long-chain acyl-CoA synthetase